MVEVLGWWGSRCGGVGDISGSVDVVLHGGGIIGRESGCWCGGGDHVDFIMDRWLLRS
jgi:hypothetical protein